MSPDAAGDLGPDQTLSPDPAGTPWTGCLLIRAWREDEICARLIGVAEAEESGALADQVAVMSGIDAICAAVRDWLTAPEGVVSVQRGRR